MTAGSRPLAPGAALYDCRITHTRLTPLRHAFTYRTYLWLVDVDHLPRLGPGLRLLAGFAAAITSATHSFKSGTTSITS